MSSPSRFLAVCSFIACSVFSSALSADLTGGFTVGNEVNFDLSANGITQWAVWGQEADNSLVPSDFTAGGVAISNLTSINNGNPLRGLGQFGEYGETTFQWNNGTNSPLNLDVMSGIQHVYGGFPTIGEGFSFTVPAGTQPTELILFTTIHLGTAQLTATLSDSSAPALTRDTTEIDGNLAHTFRIIYSAASAGQTLTVNFILTSDESGTNDGNVAIQAVAIVPEPSTVILAGLAMAAIAANSVTRRRKP